MSAVGVSVASMSPNFARRILHDWNPNGDQTEEDWLAAQAEAGWQPDPDIAGPSTVSIDGQPPVHRWAMIQTPDHTDAAGWK